MVARPARTVTGSGDEVHVGQIRLCGRLGKPPIRDPEVGSQRFGDGVAGGIEGVRFAEQTGKLESAVLDSYAPFDSRVKLANSETNVVGFKIRQHAPAKERSQD